MRSVFLIVVVVGLGPGYARDATAGPPMESADSLIERGVQLRRQGKPGEALELFERANAMTSSARALAQMGLCEMSLHRWANAEANLEAALARHDSDWIINPKTRDALGKSLVETRLHVGKLRIEGTDGAEIAIGGKMVGRLPLPAAVHLDDGPVHIHAEAPGRQAVDKDVVVASGEEVVTKMELDPLPLPTAATGVPPAPVTMALPAESQRGRKWLGAGLVAGGVAAMATGIVWLAIDNKGTCEAAPNGMCQHLYDTSLQGWVAIGAGVALAGTGTGLLLWRGHHQEVGVAVGPSSVFATGRF